MPDPIQTLMDEHRVIEKVLYSLETAAGKDLPATFYERALEFFAKYADGCHHAKEEDRLFPVLEERGIPREGGPVGVMCAEHVLGRDHIQRMRAFLEADDRAALWQESLQYAALLRQHIRKEDDILFAMARNVMTEGDVERLGREFAEAQASGACDLRYVAIADELVREAESA